MAVLNVKNSATDPMMNLRFIALFSFFRASVFPW
jgi:hypothetical protein